MVAEKRVTDRHPAIAIKEACLARSGVYNYSYHEMLARGYEPKVKKPYYSEYRPKEVLKRCMDKFGLTAVTVEHTADETDHTNFTKQAVGIVGDKLTFKPMPDGEFGIYGNMAFYTKDGYDYYKAGNRETSADYRSVCAPDPSGRYDFILKDIQSVNGVVITSRGRGGPGVRIQDSMANMLGGILMSGRKGALSFLGIGRQKDAAFKLSSIVLDGVKKLHTLDAAGKESLVGEIMSHVTGLGDGENKELLIGAIKDSLNNPTDVAKQEEKVARVIDGLYDACLSLGSDEAKEYLKGLAEGKVQDAEKEGEGDEEEKAATKDSSLTTDALIDSIVSKVTDSIDGLIDAKVKEALGVKTKSTKTDSRAKDSDVSIDEYTKAEGSFLLDSVFGN